jgi:hypothetical protein
MSHSPARNSQLPLLLLVILAATACGKSPAKQADGADSLAFVAAMEQGGSGKAASPAVVVPKDLVPVAIAATQKWCSNDRSTCKDYEVSPKTSKHLQLTAADRANGYEDAWCLTITYLERIGKEPWFAVETHRFFAKHGGAWHFDPENAGRC